MNKFLKIFLISAFFAFVFFLSLRKVSDYDIWMHLRTGERILTERSLPKIDLYSYTRPGAYWANTHWLFQIIVYPLYHKFGAAGIVLLKALVIALSFFVLFKVGYTRKKWLVSLASLFLVTLVAKDRFVERPEFFSYLFLSIYLYIIYRYRRKKTKLIWLLPILQVFWTNIHVFSFGGIAVIFIFLFGEFISWKVKLPWLWNSPDTLKSKDFWRLFFIGLLCITTSIINPYTYKIYLIPFQLFGFLTQHRSILLGGISELIPPFANTPFLAPGFFFYKLLIVFSLLSFLINYRRLNLANFFLYAIFLNLSLRAIRNIIIFSLVCAPIMVENINSFMKTIENFNSRRAFRLIRNAAVIVIVFFMLTAGFCLTKGLLNLSLYEHGRVQRIFGIGALKVFPEEAIDFIFKENISGNIFNTFGYGGYFIYRCYPERKVFIDGRTAIYGDDYLRYFADTMSYSAVFDDLIKRFNINYFLLDINTGGILKRLYNDPGWKLVYLDSQAVIFLKNTPENKLIIERYGIDLNKYKIIPPNLERVRTLKKKPYPADYSRTGLFLHGLGFYDKAQEAYKFALDINPDSADIHNNLGAVYKDKKETELAIKEYKNAISLNPYMTSAYVNLGLIYQEKGMVDEAMRLYQKAGSPFNPKNPMLHNNLGDIYKEKGFYRRAISEYDKAIQINPQRFEFFYNKGLVLIKMGRLSEALICFLKAREIDSSVALVYNSIGACYLDKGDYLRAETEFKKALELDPNLPEAKSNLEKLENLTENK